MVNPLLKILLPPFQPLQIGFELLDCGLSLVCYLS